MSLNFFLCECLVPSELPQDYSVFYCRKLANIAKKCLNSHIRALKKFNEVLVPSELPAKLQHPSMIFVFPCVCAPPQKMFSSGIGASFRIHCESGEVLWLQGEAELQTHSFRDAEPQPVIPPNANKNMKIFQCGSDRA